MAKRSYSQTTIKVLFGRSGNQCAHPDCTNPIVAPSTEHSDEAVVGQICHIYAAADNGPRGNPNLAEEERNAPENLLLFCGHHHPLVDKQWETYPAELLKAWKKEHEAKFDPETAEAAKRLAGMQQLAFVQEYTDQQIDEEVERIRKGRYILGFPVIDAALALANRVQATELAGGSTDVRARALAWCARVLSQGGTAARAAELLADSKALGDTPEARIAEAFIVANTDRDQALALLAPLNSAAGRSASLRIVMNKDGMKGAASWLERTGLTINDFDSDGKFAYIMHALANESWQVAIDAAGKIADDDLQSTPVLYHALANVSLIQAVQDEKLRGSVLIHVPTEADRFPLASDQAALAARRRAMNFFARISDIARSMGLVAASNPASDYALWLKLRDPQHRDEGLEELRASMRDPSESLRRVIFAIQFGVRVDLQAIEREIDKRVALSGKGTADEAYARYALAFTKPDPRSAAEYLAKYRDQLYEHLHKASIQTIEIELLARGGLIGTAEETLEKAVADGLGEEEQRHLRRIIAEAKGADPAAERKAQFEQTRELRDLINLANFLEDKESWHELYPYAQELFNRTGSLEDATRLVKALQEAGRHDVLFEFLSAHQDLIAQSPTLKTVWAWSLYRVGRFAEATEVRNTLPAGRNDANHRALRINIAIASGDWEDLVDFSNDEWKHRDQRSAVEMMTAGQLAQAMNGPHAKELIIAATKGAPDDPKILAGAYFHATQAGWEQSQETGQWLMRAAEKSGQDGPIRTASLQELVERKPTWDKHEASVAEQLTTGKLPVFGAAHLLNRTLIDLNLLASLANLEEPDTRRRSIVYAYSGARPTLPVPAVDKIALEPNAILTLARLGLLEKVIQTYSNIFIPHTTLGWLFQERQRATFHQPSRIKDAHHLRQLIAKDALVVLPEQLPRDHTLAKEVGSELAGLLLLAKSKVGNTPRFVVRSSPVHRVGSLLEEEADLSAYSDVLCGCQAVVGRLHAKGLLTLAEEERARSYLKLHERPWPNEPLITSDAELFLDDLSVNYLRTVGALEKLKPAGLTAYVTHGANAEAIQFISLETLTGRQVEIIETTRQLLAGGVASGRIRAMRMTHHDDDEDNEIKLHPTFGVIDISEPVDAAVVDDRFINQHLHLEGKAGQRTIILSTLDVLDNLTDRGVISKTGVYAYRTQLRRAGYQFVKVTEDELRYHLENAAVAEEQLVETAELRAIRESWLRARMAKMLQIPTEVPWMRGCTSAFVGTIRQSWKQDDVKKAAAISDWLASFLDIRGWAPSALPGNERNFALYAHTAQIALLANPLQGASAEAKKAYVEWVEGRFLREMKDHEPEALSWLITRAREIVASSTAEALVELTPDA